MGEFIALLHIAFATATDEILPGGRSPGMFGNDVVDGHISRSRSAVLTEIVVSCENSSSRELEFRHWAADVPTQLDDRRHGETAVSRGKVVVVGVQNIRFSEVDHDDGATHIADIQRFVIAVQNKRFMSHAVSSLSQTFWQVAVDFQGGTVSALEIKNPLHADSAERAFRHEVACIAHHDGDGACGEGSANGLSNLVSFRVYILFVQ